MKNFFYIAVIAASSVAVLAQEARPDGVLVDQDPGAADAPAAAGRVNEVPNATAAPAATSSQLVTLTTSGAGLVDASGVNAGNIEGVVIDPATGQLQYALVSMWYPGNRSVVTPVPWNVLTPSQESRSAGAMQRFSVPMDRTALTRAPRINLQQPGALTNFGSWTAPAQAFFSPLGVGNAGSAPLATSAQTGAFVPNNLEQALAAGSNLLGSNFLTTLFGTNVAITNQAMADAMFPAIRNWFATNAAARSGSGPQFAGTNSAIGLGGRTNFTVPPAGLGAPPTGAGVQTGDGTGVGTGLPNTRPAPNAPNGIIDNSGVPPGGTPGAGPRALPRTGPQGIPPQRIPQNQIPPNQVPPNQVPPTGSTPAPAPVPAR